MDQVESKDDKVMDQNESKDRGGASEEVYEDIFGDGTLVVKRLVVNKNPGPHTGDRVTVRWTRSIPELQKSFPTEELTFTLGDGDAEPAVELVTTLMKLGEKFSVICGYKYMYGEVGQLPDIPAKANFLFEIELLSNEGMVDYTQMSFDTRFAEGKKKKERGNVLFKRRNFDQALNSYKLAFNIVDPDLGFDYPDAPAEKLQEVQEFRAIILCNTSVTQLKLLDADSAIQSARAATKILPTYSKAFYRLGQAYDKKGQINETITAYLRALQMNTDGNMATLSQSELNILKSEVDRLTEKKQQAITSEKQMYSRMFGQDTPTKNGTKSKVSQNSKSNTSKSSSGKADPENVCVGAASTSIDNAVAIAMQQVNQDKALGATGGAPIINKEMFVAGLEIANAFLASQSQKDTEATVVERNEFKKDSSEYGLVSVNTHAKDPSVATDPGSVASERSIACDPEALMRHFQQLFIQNPNMITNLMQMPDSLGAGIGQEEATVAAEEALAKLGLDPSSTDPASLYNLSERMAKLIPPDVRDHLEKMAEYSAAEMAKNAKKIASDSAVNMATNAEKIALDYAAASLATNAEKIALDSAAKMPTNAEMIALDSAANVQTNAESKKIDFVSKMVTNFENMANHSKDTKMMLNVSAAKMAMNTDKTTDDASAADIATTTENADNHAAKTEINQEIKGYDQERNESKIEKRKGDADMNAPEQTPEGCTGGKALPNDELQAKQSNKADDGLIPNSKDLRELLEELMTLSDHSLYSSESRDGETSVASCSDRLDELSDPGLEVKSNISLSGDDKSTMDMISLWEKKIHEHVFSTKVRRAREEILRKMEVKQGVNNAIKSIEGGALQQRSKDITEKQDEAEEQKNIQEKVGSIKNLENDTDHLDKEKIKDVVDLADLTLSLSTAIAVDNDNVKSSIESHPNEVDLGINVVNKMETSVKVEDDINEGKSIQDKPEFTNDENRNILIGNIGPSQDDCLMTVDGLKEKINQLDTEYEKYIPNECLGRASTNVLKGESSSDELKQESSSQISENEDITSDESSWLQTAGYTVLGVGVVGLVGYGIYRYSKK